MRTDEESVTEYSEGVFFSICVLIGNESVLGHLTELVGGNAFRLTYRAENELSVIGRTELSARCRALGRGEVGVFTVGDLAEDKSVVCGERGEGNGSEILTYYLTAV